MEDDRESQCRNEESQQSSDAPVACPLSWWRCALLILLLNSTFFYHGCDRSTYLSIGAPTPWMVVAVDDDANWPSRLLSFSPVGLLVGLGLSVLTLTLVCRFAPWLSRLLAIAVILGTGIGLVVRLMMQGG